MQALWYERSVTFSEVFYQIFRSNEMYASVNSVFHFVVPSISFCTVTTHLLSWLSEVWLVSSFFYCAEEIGLTIIGIPFSTILLNRGCLYQTTVKDQLVWLFCFTKPIILISSSIKLYCGGNSTFVMYFVLVSVHAVLGSKVKAL